MRLIGSGEPRSLVAADISASLRGLGRGDDTAGGIALMNVTPQGFTDPFDAIVVMPHGVLLIIGVELPGPTMRLDAPLHGQWKADNWPLVGTGEAVNPGTPALAACQQLTYRLAQETGNSVPIATVLAVGPFVDTVTPGDGDLDQPVRVLYPTINALKDAVATLTPHDVSPCSAEHARAVLRAVDPATPIQPDSTLGKEGFPSAVATARSAAARPGATTQATHAPAQQPPTGTPWEHAGPGQPSQSAGHAQQAVGWPEHQQAGQPPRAATGTPRRAALLRPLPIAVVCLLVVGLIAVIAVATAGASDSPTGAQPQRKTPDLVIHHVDGLDFHVKAASTYRRCAPKAYGDLRTTLAGSDCDGVHLGSYLATVDDARVAVSIAVFEFDSRTQAAAIDALVDTPGTGWAVDLATTRDAWPDSAAGTATYRSATSGARLRLVRTVWLDGPGKDGDDVLRSVIQRAFAVPMPNLR